MKMLKKQSIETSSDESGSYNGEDDDSSESSSDDAGPNFEDMDAK